MSDLIYLAQVAASRDDWSMVVLILHRLLLHEVEGSTELSDPAQLTTLALQVLQYGDFQEQWDVAKVFPALGTGTIAPLADLLTNADADLESRWFAARILGELHDPQAIEILIQQLQTTDDDDLSQMIAEALANLGSGAIVALTQLLHAPTTRLLATQALAQIRQSQTVTPLLSVVQDQDPQIRTIAIEALSSFHDVRIPPILAQAMDDPTATVRQVAIAGFSAREDLVTTWNLIERLSTHLWDVNLGVCQQAALALGKLRQDEAVPALQRALTAKQTPLPLQLDLIRALSWIGTQAALTSLQNCLCSTEIFLSVPVCQEILTVLGRWESSTLHPIAAEILIQALTLPTIAPEPCLRRTIATGLGALQHPLVLEPLTQLLADPDAGVRLHAIAALKRLDPHLTYSYLETLYQRSNLIEALRSGIELAFREWQAELPR